MNRSEEIKNISKRIDSILNALYDCECALDSIEQSDKYVKRIEKLNESLFCLKVDLDKEARKI